MSITIKVFLEDKLYKLSPQAVTLPLVDKEMKQRFPSFLHLQYFYKGERVNDLQKILNELKKSLILPHFVLS